MAIINFLILMGTPCVLIVAIKEIIGVKSKVGVYCFCLFFKISFQTAMHSSWYEPPHDKTNKMACAPSEDSDQPGHTPSLLRVFAARLKKAWVLSYPLSAKRRLWSDWVDAQADLNLRWAHTHFVGFVMKWLIWYCKLTNFFANHFIVKTLTLKRQ